MQSPGRPEEYTRGGFTHGGWGQRSAVAGDAVALVCEFAAATFARRWSLALPRTVGHMTAQRRAADRNGCATASMS